MCIRDRVNRDVEIPQYLVCLKTGESIITTDPNQFYYNSNVCLLYTSDAADERSSVDLGGRRIIKKKKRKKLYIDDIVNQTE